MDQTHDEIRRVFREEFGFSWADLSTVGKGVPDGLLGCPPGVNVLVEIKTGRAKLNEAQERFADEWQGPIIVLRSADEARDLGHALLRQLSDSMGGQTIQ